MLVMNVEIFKIEFIVFNGNVIMCLTSIVFNISLFKMSKLHIIYNIPLTGASKVIIKYKSAKIGTSHFQNWKFVFSHLYR